VTLGDPAAALAPLPLGIAGGLIAGKLVGVGGALWLAARTGFATARGSVGNGDLLNSVTDHRIPLEVCPTSNLQTKAATSWESHPVDFYVDYGLRVTINTDNRLITDTTVSKELWLCHKHYGWPLSTIKEIIVAGFKSGFMPYREKADLLAEISAELATIQAPTNGKGAERPGERPAAPAAPATAPTPPAGGQRTVS